MTLFSILYALSFSFQQWIFALLLWRSSKFILSLYWVQTNPVNFFHKFCQRLLFKVSERTKMALPIYYLRKILSNLSYPLIYTHIWEVKNICRNIFAYIVSGRPHHVWNSLKKFVWNTAFFWKPLMHNVRKWSNTL